MFDLTTWTLPLALLALALLVRPPRVRVGRRVIRASLRGSVQTLGVVAVFVVVGLGSAVVITLLGCGSSTEDRSQMRTICPEEASEWVVGCVSAGSPDGLDTQDEPHYRIVDKCKEAAQELLCEERCFRQLVRTRVGSPPLPISDWYLCDPTAAPAGGEGE